MECFWNVLVAFREFFIMAGLKNYFKERTGLVSRKLLLFASVRYKKKFHVQQWGNNQPMGLCSFISACFLQMLY